MSRIKKAGSVFALGMTLGVTTGACSSGNTNPSMERSVTFDSLGGGSSIIEVYPGVDATPNDETSDGTFANGDQVGVKCKTIGRVVMSDTSVGEEKRQSDEWVRITGTPGSIQYATSVYIQNPDQVLKNLPNC